MANERELQEKYILLQMIENQMKQIEHDIQEISIKNQELIFLKSHLDKLKETKVNSKLKTQIGAGIYVDAELKNTKDVFVNVGAGVIVKKTTDEAKGMIDAQMKEAEKALEHLGRNIETLASKAQETQHELQHLMGKEHEH
ncbi:MAG: prefoldin subunit alpha [DPANN group archaeon]|nr:prefoldin subunit alpha [DPANN group archaeon]